jgi:hypothetical protein
VGGHDRMAVADPGSAMEEEEHRIVFIKTPDVNFLGQTPQGNLAFSIDLYTHIGASCSVIQRVRLLNFGNKIKPSRCKSTEEKSFVPIFVLVWQKEAPI